MFESDPVTYGVFVVMFVLMVALFSAFLALVFGLPSLFLLKNKELRHNRLSVTVARINGVLGLLFAIAAYKNIRVDNVEFHEGVEIIPWIATVMNIIFLGNFIKTHRHRGIK